MQKTLLKNLAPSTTFPQIPQLSQLVVWGDIDNDVVV
jgi:hypothetical protein